MSVMYLKSKAQPPASVIPLMNIKLIPIIGTRYPKIGETITLIPAKIAKMKPTSLLEAPCSSDTLSKNDASTEKHAFDARLT